MSEIVQIVTPETVECTTSAPPLLSLAPFLLDAFTNLNYLPNNSESTAISNLLCLIVATPVILWGVNKIYTKIVVKGLEHQAHNALYENGDEDKFNKLMDQACEIKTKKGLFWQDLSPAISTGDAVHHYQKKPRNLSVEEIVKEALAEGGMTYTSFAKDPRSKEGRLILHSDLNQASSYPEMQKNIIVGAYHDMSDAVEKIKAQPGNRQLVATQKKRIAKAARTITMVVAPKPRDRRDQ